jgi:membrane protease YdiL (CAAX protease family)
MSTSHPNPFAPSDRMLRQFGGLWILFFGLIAAWQEFRHERHTLALVLAVLAVTIGPLGIVWPRGIKPIFIGWMALAFPIGWAISRLVLGLLYYGMFTPVACFFRLTGRDELRLKPQREAATYWKPKPGAADKARYLRQF